MHLLFDLDGTLSNSRPGIVRCFRHALIELGADVPGESTLARYIGSPLPIRDCFAELLQTTDIELVERAVTAYRRRFEPIGMFENQLYPGVEDALVALGSSGARLHVVTAKPAVYARRIIRHFGIERHFVSVVGPGLEDTRFTKADLIHDALSENEASPGDAIVIGDRAADIVGARANGVRSIGVTWGYGEPGELAEADDLVDSWAELVVCLQRAA
jgi:phosphoglycolate phosphatase